MDNFNLANWILLAVQIICTAVVSCVSFFLKRELDKSERISDELRDFQHEVATTYVQKSDFNRTNSEIMKKLDYIQDLILRLVQGGGINGN